MRTSQIAMLAAGGVLLLMTVGALVGARHVIHNVYGAAQNEAAETPEAGDSVARAVELRDFDGIRVRNGWKIDLVESNQWSVELEYPENRSDAVDVEVRDGLLVLASDQSVSHGWWWGRNSGRFTARIGMPSLGRIIVEGTADIDFSGFAGDSLEINVEGAANIEAHGGEYERVVVNVSGASNVDLRELRSVNAEVDLSGASNLMLNMDGGVLTGELSGFGNVQYRGDVSEQSVKLAGFGRVHPGF